MMQVWRACPSCHFITTAIMVVFGLMVAAWTQPYWAPFDDCEPTSITLTGRVVEVGWDCEVYNRYPVKFQERMVHESGRATVTKVSLPTTGKFGKFQLVKVAHLPVNPLPGEWCYVIEAIIKYDWRTIVQTYPHACVDVDTDLRN